MANRFRGFARVFSSTVKNSTTKECSCRMFSSNATEDYWIDMRNDRMKELYGDVDYRSLSYAQRKKIIDRRAKREFDLDLLEGISIGTILGCLYGYFVYGWYPFKDTLGGDHKDYGNQVLQREMVPAQIGFPIYHQLHLQYPYLRQTVVDQKHPPKPPDVQH